MFLTFSLSTFAMLRASLQARGKRPEWWPRVRLFALAFALCATILGVTVYEKFPEGGWLTLGITGLVVLLCFGIRRHYRSVARKLRVLYAELEDLPAPVNPPPGAVDRQARTAAVLVAGFGGVGIHTVLSVLRLFPGDFKNLVFLSVGVIDSGVFKGEDSLDSLETETETMLRRYADLARRLGMAADYRFAIGIDVVAEAEKLCLGVANDFPKSTFFIGKVIFEKEAWYHRFLHNETAFAVQKRLELAGKPMVILPARVQ